MSRERLRALASAVAVAVAVVIFVRAGAGQWDLISHASVRLNPGWLAASFAINMLSFLADTLSVQLAYRAVASRPELLTFKRTIALYNVSSLLKYLPGRVWVLVSQVERATRGGLEAEVLLQANLTCTVIGTATGLMTGAVFLVTYGLRIDKGSVAAFALAPLAAAVAGVAIYRFSPVALASLMKVLRRPMPPSFRLPSDGQLLWLFFMYVSAWIFTGIGGVTAWLAFGRPHSFNDVVLVGSSMGAGWTVALLAFVVPGGLGVREGAMLWMLDSSVGRETALLLPLLTRLIYMACEGFLGALGLAFAREPRVSSEV
jgi:uncharacterized membrane protein YbhN (UPF0104 family)